MESSIVECESALEMNFNNHGAFEDPRSGNVDMEAIYC